MKLNKGFRECAEEEVQDSEENRGEDAKTGEHWLEGYELERAGARPEYGAGDGFVGFLDWSVVTVIAGFFSELLGATAQKNRKIRLRNEKVKAEELEEGPNDHYVISPAPGCVIVDEAA